MAAKGLDKRHFLAESGGGHVYKGPAKRVRALTGPLEYDAFIVVLAGTYRAEWEEEGQAQTVTASEGDVVYRARWRSWMESNDPGPALVAMVLYFKWGKAGHPGEAEHVKPRSKQAQVARELPVKVADRDGLIRTLAQAVMANQDSRSVNRQVIENGFMAGVVAEYLRLGEHASPALQGRVTEYVYMHLRSPIVLEDLARHVGMGPRQLQRVYKSQTGMTPMEQVRRVRVEAAVRMLMSATARSLKDAAMKTGFCNEQAMCARIKRHTGLTVGELRGRVKKNDMRGRGG